MELKGRIVIIEEWMAWSVVRERERELIRRARIRDAGRKPAAETPAIRRFRPPGQQPPERAPRHRRAA